MRILTGKSGRRKIIQIISGAMLSVFLSVSVQAVGLPGTGQEAKSTSETGFRYDSRNSLQFKSGEHIIGFTTERVYMASLDHALSVEFVGGRKVVPRVVSAKAGDDRKGPGLLGRVEYPNQWKGITIRYDATGGGIAESTYIIEPGADVRAITLRYNVPVEAGPDGSLRFKMPSKKGWMTETAPVAWQEIGGNKVPVKVAFKVADGLVGFDAVKYDPQYALIIDPIYEWHTFYGQVQSDEGSALAIDGSGNVYIAGSSYNSLTPGTWNGDAGQLPLHPHSGNSDFMVMKLNSEGAYQWHTFYGDGDRQWANGIAVDGSGNVYVTGFTDGAQWLGDGGAAPVRYGQSDGAHIVVLKLNTDGVYQWHTFYGYWVDEGDAIAVDGSNLYVTGYSAGTAAGAWVDMPAPLHAHSGSGYDMVVLKLNSSSGEYQWHTFYGASGDDGYDEGHGLAVDASGNVYVTGESQLTWGTPLHDHSYPGTNGKPDISILKLNSSGEYQWHTFYGATYANPYWATGEVGYGIAVDASGNVYVTGESSATWQGPGGQNPLHAYNASQDITVLKLDTNGAYQWHTFYGSDSHNYGHAIAVNGNGVYVAGDGFGTWLGDGGSNPLHPLGSSSGLTVLRLNTSGAYQWHTFYDYSASNVHHGIAADETGNIFVSGTSSDSWLGDESTSPIHTYTDGNDITVLKLNDAMTLTVSQEGTGSGTVTSSPSGIDCGSNCTADFAYNSSVTLLASADRGSSFTGWTGCDNPSGFYCTMVMDADKTVTATFGTATGIKVISPNGGEVLPAGSSQLIQWEAPLKAITFKLKYSLDKGLTWKPIISSDPITGTSFMWTVPSVNKNMNTCLVKVDGFTASNVKVGSDKSNGPFKIEVVRLTLPNGGEALTSGIPYSVTWTTHETVREVASVKIMYTINGGKTWKNAGTETGNPGFHDWTPSVGTTKTKCKVKIILKDQNGASLGSDLSDTFFRIEANQ